MNIYAHRGNSGFFPENTMYAFKKSLDLDICGIEIDRFIYIRFRFSDI